MLFALDGQTRLHFAAKRCGKSLIVGFVLGDEESMRVEVAVGFFGDTL